MDKIILILGASSDIGIELIKSINEKCVVIAHYNTTNKNLLSIENSNIELVTIQSDLTNADQVFDMINAIENKFGTPNKIVHLASSKFENIRFKDIDINFFQKEIDLSLKSLIIILTHFLPILAKKKEGKVVVMLSSVTLNIPPQALVQYTTIKYALLGLVKSLASEYASKNIQINAVSPSMIETKFLENINEKIVELNAYNHPLKRNAVISDVIPVLKMLLSEESDYMNGINIPITGGSVF